MIGKVLGRYKITEALGSGGMGEVYLAEDTLLGRKVAIKVLPAKFAADPDRLARFEREARATAALSNPHIATVHDVGVDGNTHFIVQEYLQGRPLSRWIEEGPLPTRRAVALAKGIAEGLAAAHEAGIVHRDLKPDNIFVAPDGRAKILDFGLARWECESPLDQDTVTSGGSPTTRPGALLGTIHYMSPEQVAGRFHGPTREIAGGRPLQRSEVILSIRTPNEDPLGRCHRTRGTVNRALRIPCTLGASWPRARRRPREVGADTEML